MTQDEIIRMAREAGVIPSSPYAMPFDNQREALERFAALVAAHEREKQAEQEPVAWYDKIKGMEVSVDVSTGEDNDYHRIFGRVDGVMLQSCGAQEDTILVIEDSRNFAAPVQQVDLTDGEIGSIYEKHHALGGCWTDGFAYERAVIAKFKEKNK